jgi:hypothetical protein
MGSLLLKNANDDSQPVFAYDERAKAGASRKDAPA